MLYLDLWAQLQGILIVLWTRRWFRIVFCFWLIETVLGVLLKR